MFALFGRTEDSKYGYVFDSDDFSVEKHKMDYLISLVRRGFNIKGINVGKTYVEIFDIETSILYSDSSIAVVESCLDKNYIHHISFYPKGCKYPSYTVAYNCHVEGNSDKVVPKVVIHNDNIFEVQLFGKNIGWSFCVINLGNGVLKPIYKDNVFVKRSSELVVYVNGNDIKISREG